MLTEKTNRIVGLIQKYRGMDRSQDERKFVPPGNTDRRNNPSKRKPNMDLVLPLVLNAHSLGLGGFQASMLVTLVNLIVQSDMNLLPLRLKELSDKMKISQSTLERHISQLKDSGFLTVDKTLDDRGFARNIYRFSGLVDKLRSIGVEI